MVDDWFCVVEQITLILLYLAIYLYPYTMRSACDRVLNFGGQFDVYVKFPSRPYVRKTRPTTKVTPTVASAVTLTPYNLASYVSTEGCKGDCTADARSRT